MNPTRDSENAVDVGPDDSFHGRFSHLISTQCQRSVRILGESTENRPLSLKDFKETLERSVNALNVSYLDDFNLIRTILFSSASTNNEAAE